MAEIHHQLVDALNRLRSETGATVEGMRFSRSDVPIDWDDEVDRWVVLGEESF